MNKKSRALTGNEAVAEIAYKTNEVCAIYPITPSSDMSELVEEWSAYGRKNCFGGIPTTVQMQNEAGVAGVMHGALQTGSLTTTFTASQGLLLMVPNMFRIAGELTPNVIHVATRSLATHALSVFGDHSDVMAARSTGYAMLASANVQEAMDMALIAQAATLKSRIPFLHFFDGFRTSHERASIETIPDETIQAMVTPEMVGEHRARALNPERPIMRGTAQAADVFFQGREAINTYYQQCPDIVQAQMDTFERHTGRAYRLFDYTGHPQAERIIITMASSTDTVERTVTYLSSMGEKVGLIRVRLYRPFSVRHLLDALPATTKAIAVLDRTKEPGSTGEPLYQDVAAALAQASFTANPKLIGGRYGLSSKEFTPAMAKAIFDHLNQPKLINSFTVGITDDVTGLSLPVSDFNLPETALQILISEPSSENKKALFAKLETNLQAYNEIDYRKADARTITNLRISKSNENPQELYLPFLIEAADLLFIDNLKNLTAGLLSRVRPGGAILFNEADVELSQLKSALRKREISLKKLDIMVAEELPVLHQAVLHYSDSEPLAAVKTHTNELESNSASRSIHHALLAGEGNEIPVSLLPVDGTFPTNSSEFNPKVGGETMPAWDSSNCTQCGLCSLSCPQAALRLNVVEPPALDEAPVDFTSVESNDFPGRRFTIQLNADQCNSCGLCFEACETDALKPVSKADNAEKAMTDWDFFQQLPLVPRTELDASVLSQQQLQEPLFKYSTGDKGCSEALYLKLLSQLFGDRLMVANATGASSIFGGALPTTPWGVNADGRGPAWSNSLFEDNAEFGMGFRISLDQQRQRALALLDALQLTTNWPRLAENQQRNETEIAQQRKQVDALKDELLLHDNPMARELLSLVDSLVRKSVWLVGGDGWAYDAGFSGLDHVLSSGENVNILVLDNEVYSNTGGQVSKATPYGAAGRFAARGKRRQKKDLATLAMHYEDVYVASIAIGADPQQTLTAIREAEQFNGPSVIVAYCHSPAHGIDMEAPFKYHKAAVASGQWPLFRYNPERVGLGLRALQLDSTAEPTLSLRKYLQMEQRFAPVFEEISPQMLDNLQSRIHQRVYKLRNMSGSVAVCDSKFSSGRRSNLTALADAHFLTAQLN